MIGFVGKLFLFEVIIRLGWIPIIFSTDKNTKAATLKKMMIDINNSYELQHIKAAIMTDIYSDEQKP